MYCRILLTFDPANPFQWLRLPPPPEVLSCRCLIATSPTGCKSLSVSQLLVASSCYTVALLVTLWHSLVIFQRFIYQQIPANQKTAAANYGGNVG